MLDKLAAEDFLPKLDKTVEVVVADGPKLELEIKEVKENPKSRPYFAEADSRMPFSVVLKGPIEPCIPNFGFCTIKGLQAGDLEGIHITRILPESSDPSAWYQIIFN